MIFTNHKSQNANNGFNGVYVITAENKKLGRSHADVCQAALEGGARIIQYRDKYKKKADMIKEAKELKSLCQSFNAIFIVNDSLEVANESDADGVHLGQNDADFRIARQKLPNKIIGLSATCLQEAIEAEEKGCNYIGAGPVFDTPSKADAAPPFGLDELSKIRKATNVPLVAIGGINKGNANKVIKAGSNAVAVISAINGAEDMVKATQDLLRQAGLAQGITETGTLLKPINQADA